MREDYDDARGNDGSEPDDARDELLNWLGRAGFDLHRSGMNKLSDDQLKLVIGRITRIMIDERQKGFHDGRLATVKFFSKCE